MSTVPRKNKCAKCIKGAGIVTCDGCHQSFCHKHLSEHRKELFEEVDQINDQCKQFKKDLGHQNDPTSLLSSIDNWEEESMEKIRSTAEHARVDVRQMMERTFKKYNQSIDQIIEKINYTKQNDDVTEIDLTKWIDELQKLDKLIKKPFAISIIDDNKSSIPSIKVNCQTNFTQTKQVSIKQESNSQEISSNQEEEEFSRIAGHANFSDNNSIMTSFGYSSTFGIKRYGRGIHHIQFEIVDKRNEGIFFGIITSIRELTPRASELPSVYGWRDFDRVIINGNAQLKAHKEKNIQIGDQLTLTIDCDHPKLILTHHQLKQKVQMKIDLNKCPLPWKLIISSFGQDVIAILH